MKKRGFEIVKGYENNNIELPVRKTAHSAGYDIQAAEDIVLPKYYPGIKPALIPTGLKCYMQSDECLLLLNRSSGPKKGFLMANSIGLIDSDYYGNEENDGHIFFSYFNCSDHDIEIKKGDVIGQAVFTHFLTTDNDVAKGTRTGGFGSTDKNL